MEETIEIVLEEPESETKTDILIDEDGASLVIIREWIDSKYAHALCSKLSKEVNWQRRTVIVGGREVLQARAVYACGDSDIKLHNYSGTSIRLTKWIPEVKDIRDQIDALLKKVGWKTRAINSCLFNEYSSGESHISWHSDDEVNKEVGAVISVSLGGTRDFYLRSKADRKRIVKTKLNNGDLCMMLGKFQKLWKHCVPKRARADYRISLTFRHLPEQSFGTG